MTTVAMIQARMGSTRLPGKVLISLCGKSVLAHVIARVRACPLVERVVVATSVAVADDAIVVACDSLGVTSYRGSEDDVLARFYGAAQAVGASVIVRVTADCPLLDPELLTRMLELFRQRVESAEPVDYLSNTLTRSYPRGLDLEIFTFAALQRAMREADSQAQREHVTPYIYQHPQSFRLEGYLAASDHSMHRWTLDTPADLELIEAIYGALHTPERLFTTDEVLALLEARPELVALNSHVEQKPLEVRS